MNERSHLDLFSGIFGFGLASERAGFKTTHVCEINDDCHRLLSVRRPLIGNLRDVRWFQDWKIEKVDLITGGDPCPKHSRARSNGESVHPDLSGYFLAVVGRFQPEWVVRENVPAPTVASFATALEFLGYRSVIIRADAASFTAQSRQRDFIVGCNSTSRRELYERFIPICQDGAGAYETRLGTRPVIPALTTHRTRYDSRDCYIYDSGRLRILEAEERETFAGFPTGWTAGFSEATRAKMLGNAVVPAQVYPILKAIHEALTHSK